MKKITIQLVSLAIAIIAFSATEAVAQKRIKFDKNGKAKVSATIKAKSGVSFTISGREFKNVSIRCLKCEGLGFELRRGSEFLSSGHTANVIRVKSDGRSEYSMTIINKADKSKSIVLSFQKAGSGDDTAVRILDGYSREQKEFKTNLIWESGS